MMPFYICGANDWAQKTGGVVVPLSDEYIREWLVLGPFFPDDLDTDFLVDVGGEANIEPKEDDIVTTADGTTLTWKRYKSKTDIIELLYAVAEHEHATAYAFCVLRCETAGDVQISLGSSDGVAVWINGQQVHSNPVSRGFTFDEDVFEASLKAGDNRCLVKIFNGTGTWDLAMRVALLPPDRAVLSGMITDETDKPIPDAEVSVEQACPRAKRRDGKEIARTRTDTSGSYQINIYPVHGTYDFSATSGNLGDWQLGIRLSEGERRTLNLTLKEAISLEGTLLMLDGTTPHVAVPVQAVLASSDMQTETLAVATLGLRLGLSRQKATHDFVLASETTYRNQRRRIETTLSDEHGKYQFINLKPGQYQVRCQIWERYVYYGKQESQNHVSRFTQHAMRKPQYGDIFCVEQNKTLSNINFHFADFKKGTWRNYTHLDGLAHNSVKDIYRDPDGVMWFATEGGGISRYDGKEFKNFTTKDGLAGNAVWVIHRDPDGVMWFGAYGGVSRYDFDMPSAGFDTQATQPKPQSKDGKAFVNFLEDELENDSVMAIHRDPDGVMWFGSYRSGVFRYDGRTFVKLTTKDGLVSNSVKAIYRASDGVMWFGGLGGVSRGVYPEFMRRDGKAFVTFTNKDGLAGNDVNVIHCDPDGVMWFGTFGDGISRYDGNQFVNFTQKDGLAHNNVWAIHQDPDGVMWFGTWGGVSRYDGNGFVNFTQKDGLAHNVVYAIHRDPDGVMWFGTIGGVSRYDGNGFVNFTQKDGLVSNSVSVIHCAPDGVVWFGTGPYRGGGVSRYTKDGLASNSVMAIHQDPDGALWFGTGNRLLLSGKGVSRYGFDTQATQPKDGKEFTTFTTKDGLASNTVGAVYRDSDGILWFGTGNYWPEIGAGVSRYDGKAFLPPLTTKDGLTDNTVTVIHQSPDGAMWFGTYRGGVSRYDGKEFLNFTIEEGLVYNTVWAIHQDPDGILWFATEGGISCYDGITWMSLDTRDGLAGNTVYSIDEDSDGFLWFGTDKGVTRYRRNRTPPSVRIVSVTTDQTYWDLSNIPAFTPKTRVTIEYNAIDFKTLPEKRQYCCRIKEIDSDWHPRIVAEFTRIRGSATKATSFDYTFDKPGTYTFEVQAIDRDLNYSEPAMLSLTIQPDPLLFSLQTQLNHLRREVGGKYHFENIIGRSAGMKQLRALMEKAIDSGLTVLITGETGTGKELVAKAIHYNSPRKGNPLLDLNCGAVPKDLVASTLFGHRKGAFTGANEDKMGLFETAEGGTVLLDEISEMPQDAQIHLLRVLEERKVQRLGEHISRDVDVRIIAMTNRDIVKEVEADRFREDLYYRISEFPIHIPPLRERVEDIPILAEHFLQEIDKELDGFAPDVFEMLQSYAWPGNVRELRNVIRRAAAFVEEGLHIHTYHFPSQITRGESLIQETLSERVSLSNAVDSFQRRLIEDTLRECDGNRAETARMLGIHRPNLVRLMKRLGIEQSGI